MSNLFYSVWGQNKTTRHGRASSDSYQQKEKHYEKFPWSDAHMGDGYMRREAPGWRHQVTRASFMEHQKHQKQHEWNKHSAPRLRANLAHMMQTWKFHWKWRQGQKTEVCQKLRQKEKRNKRTRDVLLTRQHSRGVYLPLLAGGESMGEKWVHYYHRAQAPQARVRTRTGTRGLDRDRDPGSGPDWEVTESQWDEAGTHQQTDTSTMTPVWT